MKRAWISVGVGFLFVMMFLVQTAQAKILQSYDVMQDIMSLNAVMHVKQDAFFTYLYFRKLNFAKGPVYHLALYDRRYGSLLSKEAKVILQVEDERFILETIQMEKEVGLPFFLHPKVDASEAVIPSEAIKLLRDTTSLRLIYAGPDGEEQSYDLPEKALLEWKEIIADVK